MKKNYALLGAFVFIGMLLAVSCSKKDLLKFKWDRYAEAEGYVANCKLRSFTYARDYTDFLFTGTISYADNGHPTSIIIGPKYDSGNPYHYFYYDDKNRLREYRITYGEEDFITLAMWHRYGYNDKNQIISDTLFNPEWKWTEEGEADGYELGNPRRVSTLTYDNKGRIVKELLTWLHNDGAVDFIENFVYNYDARGNLIVDKWDPAWYDDKVSVLRSHPVFTFVNRNYSKNNPLNPTANTPAREYNSKKLPLSVIPSNYSFFDAVDGLTALTYDCK